jgi:hypothetical protein
VKKLARIQRNVSGKSAQFLVALCTLVSATAAIGQITFVNAPDTVVGSLGVAADAELTVAWGIRNDSSGPLTLRVTRSIVEAPEVVNCPFSSGNAGSYERFCWGPLCYDFCTESSSSSQSSLVTLLPGATNWSFYADFYPAGISGSATYRYCFHPTSGIQPWSCRNVTYRVDPVVGCTYPAAQNFNPEATVDDGSCVYAGCTDPAALNWHPFVSVPDGSCIYADSLSLCAEDLDGDGHVGLGDLLIFLTAFGEPCGWD